MDSLAFSSSSAATAPRGTFSGEKRTPYGRTPLVHSKIWHLMCSWKSLSKRCADLWKQLRIIWVSESASAELYIRICWSVGLLVDVPGRFRFTYCLANLDCSTALSFSAPGSPRLKRSAQNHQKSVVSMCTLSWRTSQRVSRARAAGVRNSCSFSRATSSSTCWALAVWGSMSGWWSSLRSGSVRSSTYGLQVSTKEAVFLRGPRPMRLS
mmetsp:Transcript_32554/g.62545  ORF Transcript_32554/g.62545 Transcript_32554/m.62545 type:complete len:210 (+) Transcript_32554:1074-1703(+)